MSRARPRGDCEGALVGRRVRASSEGPIHPPAEQAATETGAGDAVQGVPRTANNRSGGALTTANGGPDSLAQITRGKTCGVSSQKSITEPRRVHRTKQVVAVARGIGGYTDPE